MVAAVDALDGSLINAPGEKEQGTKEGETRREVAKEIPPCKGALWKLTVHEGAWSSSQNCFKSWSLTAGVL